MHLYRFYQVAALAWLSLTSSAQAWSDTGHQTVALLAEPLLTDKARAELAVILSDGEDLAQVATWADDIRGQRPSTAAYHYVDIPLGWTAPMTDLGPFCGKSGGRCIVGQLERAIEQLRTSVAPDERREAMMWIVHLVGDIHQPLHCSTDGDRGGNEKWVRVTYKSPGGAKIKLHALWDHLMRLSDSENSASELANSLRLTPKQADTMGLGTPLSWSVESWELARKLAYLHLPAGPIDDSDAITIAPEDVAYLRKVALTQLQRAGARLAALLNAALR